MPSLSTKFSFGKKSTKHYGRRASDVSTQNDFSALSPMKEEPEATVSTLTSTKEETDEASALGIANVTTGLKSSTINAPANHQDQGGWQNARSRRYGHNKTAIGTKNNIPEGNWNKNKQVPPNNRGSTYIGKSVRRGASTAYTAGRQLLRGYRTKSGVGFAQQNPGVLVWHWDYRPILNRNIPVGHPQHKYVTKAPDGSLWIKKGRFWIIVARAKHAVTEVPVYTYDDKGLEGKSEDVRWEYLSVMAPKFAGAGTTFVNQSPGNPLIAIEFLKDPDEAMRSTMVAHFTEAITRDVDCDELRLVGNMRHQANEVLLDKIRNHMGGAPDDH